MFSKRKTKPDPKLESLRRKGSKAPPVGYDVNQILEKTKNIHAAWLFNFNLILLQKLLRYLDGNRDTINTPGWLSFGSHLGISIEILRVIECSNLGGEGYTYYVLQHYIQKNDATIQKIIQALLDIKRLDVIHETQSYFNELAEKVLDGNQNQEDPDEADSGISITSSSSSSSSSTTSSSTSDIIRPRYIPTPAFILRELEEHIQLASLASLATITSNNHELTRTENESIQTSDTSRFHTNIQENQVSPTNSNGVVIPKYNCKIMLTFAADGINFAIDVARTFRATREDGQKIGVLILNEQEKLAQCNPELFISGSFPQVDYVVPIITEGYLKAIMNTKSPIHDEFSYLDCKYVRFIYILMSKYYVRSGCLNKKIRCVIPDGLTKLTHKTLMREPIFEAWVKSSSVDKLAERMLTRCARKRNNKPQITAA